MQFMSQSMGWADNVILAMVPLGIMTAVVGAIRVGGPTWLKALIGRARENRAVVESELMSSTSHEVCELWNGQQIVRIMGEGEIREFIILVGEDSDSIPDDEAEDILDGEHSSRPASADAQDNESFDEEAYEAVDPESNEDHYVEDDEGYDGEDDEGPDAERKESFDVQHEEDFDVNDNVGSGAEDNKEEDLGINSAAKVEIMELRDDEKKRHLAEYSK
jgi:hypothetical protein